MRPGRWVLAAAAALALIATVVVTRDEPSRVTVMTRNLYLGGATFTFQHGYAWAEVEMGRDRLRFVATHLESQSADVALAQAEEPLAGPAAFAATTVVACDCESGLWPSDHAGVVVELEIGG